MRARFGHQGWWPGETPLEVCVGAILTQNTNWENVERAIANLKSARMLDARKLFALSESELAALIRPAGYFNVKARRLRAFLRVLMEQHGGDLTRLFTGDTAAVRARLLAINGIGPQTACCSMRAAILVSSLMRTPNGFLRDTTGARRMRLTTSCRRCARAHCKIGQPPSASITGRIITRNLWLSANSSAGRARRAARSARCSRCCPMASPCWLRTSVEALWLARARASRFSFPRSWRS